MDPQNPNPQGENNSLKKLEEDLQNLTKENQGVQSTSDFGREGLGDTVSEAPTSTTSTTVTIEEKPKKSVIPSLFMLLIGGLILFFAVWQLRMMFSNNTNVNIVSTPTPAPSATADPTANWKTYNGKVFSFKYPSSWYVKEEYSDYISGDILTIDNPTKIVSIEIAPQQHIYGTSGPSVLKKSKVSFTMFGKEYSSEETELDKTSIFVDQEINIDNKKYFVLFGSGYPVNNNLTASLSEYASEKDIIFQILSTFKFTGPINSTSTTTPSPKACTLEAKLCPNGEYVGRTGPNCEFAPCPQ